MRPYHEMPIPTLCHKFILPYVSLKYQDIIHNPLLISLNCPGRLIKYDYIVDVMWEIVIIRQKISREMKSYQ